MAYKKSGLSLTKKERIKKTFSSKKVQDEFFSLLDSTSFFLDKKKLSAYKKKHRKEIAEIAKRIDINKIIQKVQLLSSKK
jgi:hypothetical protein